MENKKRKTILKLHTTIGTTPAQPLTSPKRHVPSLKQKLAQESSSISPPAPPTSQTNIPSIEARAGSSIPPSISVPPRANIRTTTQVDGNPISPTGTVTSGSNPNPIVILSLPPRESLPPRPTTAGRKRKAQSEVGPSGDWKPEMRVAGRNNVVQSDDVVRGKGVALALARGLALPTDEEACKNMSAVDRWEAIHQHMIESVQLVGAAMDDHYTLCRAYYRQHDKLEEHKHQKMECRTAKEAVERAEAELAKMGKTHAERVAELEGEAKALAESAQSELARLEKVHAEKVAELEGEMRRREELGKKNLKNALDAARASATANLQKAVAREAEIKKNAELQIHKLADKAREKITLAEEVTWKADAEKRALEHMLMEKGAKGVTPEDIDALLMAEWDQGVAAAQEEAKVDILEYRRDGYNSGWIEGLRAYGVDPSHPLMRGPPENLLPTLLTPLLNQ